MKASAIFRLLLLAATLSGSLFGVGCATSDEQTVQSTRPWNQPRGWETGVPGMLQQDRRY